MRWDDTTEPLLSSNSSFLRRKVIRTHSTWGQWKVCYWECYSQKESWQKSPESVVDPSPCPCFRESRAKFPEQTEVLSTFRQLPRPSRPFISGTGELLRFLGSFQLVGVAPGFSQASPAPSSVETSVFPNVVHKGPRASLPCHGGSGCGPRNLSFAGSRPCTCFV